MYKKIAISFLALILVFNFSMKDYADAAIASKAASQAAKQIAKEVIQDIAVETAANFALHQAMNIAGDYEAKQGYKVVCPDGAADCAKPIQVKENLTDSDKQAIKGQAGSELDNLLNNGKGVGKWQKFLDWFLPVWLISFGATALTYAFDSDVRSLFNEAGYNALVALGFIQPLGEIQPLGDSEPEVDAANKYVDSGGVENTMRQSSLLLNGSYSNHTFGPKTYSAATVIQNSLMVVTMDYPNENSGAVTKVHSKVGMTWGGYDNSTAKGLYPGPSTGEAGEVVVLVNGEQIYNGQVNTALFNSPEIESILNKKIKSVMLRAPYEIDGFMYTDVLYNTVSGDVMELQTKRKKLNSFAGRTVEAVLTYENLQNVRVSVKYFENIQPIKRILVPTYEEVTLDGESTIQKSNYEDDSGNVALIPPTALTYKEESTGETVYRVPAAIPTEPAQFQKEDGTIVPEENITVDPAPTVTPAPAGSTTEKGEPIPEGTPTVTPAPTPTNPAPAPIPLTPTQPAPDPSDPTTPPANGEEPPMEPFPEGESCQEKLKFPIFSPLKEQFSTSFPFSIPWDMERAINAAFSEIGNEKPSFTLDLAFMGGEKQIEITMPKMFDDWKPFTDTLLLLTFDILIMFGVYRFVKGAGS